MINDTQILIQNFPAGNLEGDPYKIFLDKIGVYVNKQTSGIHSNEGWRKLGYISISEQPSVYATQSGITEFPVSINLGKTVTYPGGNLMEAVILATKRSHQENIRIWKE